VGFYPSFLCSPRHFRCLIVAVVADVGVDIVVVIDVGIVVCVVVRGVFTRSDATQHLCWAGVVSLESPRGVPNPSAGRCGAGFSS